VTPNPFGMSLLLTTPALLYIIRARQRSPLVVGAWAAVVLVLATLLFSYNTGYVQFGHRFSLDFMIPVMVLLAAAAGNQVSRLMRAHLQPHPADGRGSCAQRTILPRCGVDAVALRSGEGFHPVLVGEW